MHGFPGWRASGILTAAILLCAGGSAQALTFGQSFFIPTEYAHDFAFDPATQTLFISRASVIERYNVTSRQFLSPWSTPYGVYPLKLSADGRHLYAAGYPGTGQPAKSIIQVDLATQAQQQFISSASASSIYDLACMADNSVFFTSTQTDYLRQLDPTTGLIIPRIDAPEARQGSRLNESTAIFTSGDLTTLMVWEGNTSRATVYTYNIESQAFSPAIELNGHGRAALNGNGSLIAIGMTIYDRNLRPVHQLTGMYGVAFDPGADILYARDSTTATMIGIDTSNWSELFRFPLNDYSSAGSYFGAGRVSISSDGQYLFHSYEDGIRAYWLPEPATVTLLGLGLVCVLCRRRLAA